MLATSSVSVLNVNDGQEGAPGAQGPQGISVIGSREQWFLSTSNTGLTGSPNTIDVNGVSVLVGQWTYTEPAVIPDGYYLWGRIENTFARIDDAEIASSDGLLVSSDGTLVCGYYSSPVPQYSDAIYRSVISGIKSMVDYNRKAITDKVWETDIENHVYGADDGDGGYTMSSISDRVTQTEQDISGITTTVSEVQSQVDNKADGSTVQTLSENFSTFQQTMSGFKTTVESNYATKVDIDNIKVSGNNLYIIKDQVLGFLNQSGGVSAPSSTSKEKTSAYIPVTPGKTYVIQAWATPNTSGQSWLGYQFFTDKNESAKIGNRVAKYGSASSGGAEITAEGQERLMYKTVAPETAKYLRVSYSQFDDGYAMVEQATTPSEYAIATTDIQNESSQIRTISEQTAEGFSWIVQDGSSASNVIYTSNALTAMANQIDLTGKVTFNSMDSTLQSRVTTAEGNASTAKSQAASAVDTANTASDNASSALSKVNNSIQSTTMHYLASSASSGVTTSTSGWSTNIQTITVGKPYLWTYQTVTKVGGGTYNTDPVISGVYGNTGGKGDKGDPGNAGVSVTKVEQLYRTSNSTTAPAAPTSKVESTSTAANTWTLAMPTYNSSYPYYYTCTQTTYSNGNYTWTTVARSQAIEDANKTANTANTNASNAVTTANTANGKADTAVSTANTASKNATAAVGTANEANTTANTALNGIKAFVGTSSTAAGTAAKVVNCSDDTFAMTNGVIITVTFSNASTADAPTLNVKSLGAKAIYFDNAVTSSSNRFRWKAGSVITFQYNGTYWVVLNYENLEYFTSSTAAGTADKTNASITGTFVLCRGTTINVYFSTANTANAPTLNVSATGAFPIYYKNAVTSASNKYLWDAGTTLTFTFNGSYWHINDGRAGAALDWISTNGSTVITASDIMKTWTGDATLATTTIDGGYIKTHTIEAKHLATDAIMSNNYKANTSFVYSTTGTFLDLANGNITSPTFAVDNTNGTAYIDGTISARTLLVGAATVELSASAGTLNSSQGVLICNALDAASDYLIYDGESICIKTSNFSIDPAGNVTMTGEVNAASGSIGGWTISPKNLHYGSSVGSEGSVYLIPEGSMSYHTVGGSPEMSGWVITAGDSFGVTNNGSLYANDANITGTFTINDGGIGGMTIDSDSVYGTTAGMSSNQAKWAFWAGETNGKHGASDTNAVFKVGSNGKLYATNAEITGKITAQSGTIGGWKIDDDSLYYYTDDTVPQVGTANSVFLFPEGSSTKKSIGGSPSTTNGWVFTAGNGFGVTRSGSVYANNGKIGGVTLSGGNIYAYNNTGSGTTAIPSFSLTSGGVLAIGGNNGITVDEDGVLRIPAVRITGTLTANQIAAGAITASKLSVTIGGNNLLRNSHADKTGSSTPWIWSYGPNPPKSGDKLTFQVKGSSLGSSQQIVTFGVTHTISLAYNSTTGTYVGTFTLSVSNSSDTYFRFNPGSTSATCDWVKLEYGDMPTPWSPSPDEAAGFDVDATAIHTSGVAVTSNADNSVALSSADFTRTINSISRSGLRFAIGAHFGVSGAGALYSSSGVIGGLTISSNYMSYGTIGDDASTFIGALNYGLSHNNAKATVAGQTLNTWRLTVGQNFGVTGSGMYATGGKIGGFTIGKNTISSNTANGTNTVAFTISSLSNYSAVLIKQNNSYYTRVGLSEIEVVGGTGTTISAGTISTNEIQATGEIETTALGSGGTVKLHSGVDNGLFVQNRLTNGANQEVRFILNNNSNAGIYDVTKQRWALVYNINNGQMASNSQISVSSDERIKKIYRHLNNDHKKLFMALDPIEFSFIDKPDEIHFGFGAQTTEISMRKLGFGSEYNLVSHPLNGEMDTYGRRDSYYMNYIEALMLSVPVVQDHEKEIAKLKTKIEELENKLSQLT